MGTETRRAAVTAVAGLMALAFPGAIASDLADAALVDLGALVECDAQETVCPEALGYLSPQQPDLHMTHAGVPPKRPQSSRPATRNQRSSWIYAGAWLKKP